jgi:hypothetical protein
MPADFPSILPELSAHNQGEATGPEAWLRSAGSYELALGYSLILWPRFVQFENYVLRAGFSMELLRDFEDMTNGYTALIEEAMNLIRIADIHPGDQPTERQIRDLGGVLKETHSAKLQRDFPTLRFDVAFNDEPGRDPREYELSFWQAEGLG